MKPKDIYTTLAICIGLSCYLPSLYLFMDTCLLPKWYLFLIMVACAGIAVAMMMLRKKRLQPEKMLPVIFSSIVIFAFIECLWVGYDIMVHGFRQGGEVGTFSNSAELAFGLCVAIPWSVHGMSHAGNQLRRILYGISTVSLVLVLVLTHSRTGIICLALYLVVYGVRVCFQLTSNKTLRILTASVLSMFVLAIALFHVMTNKNDSTSGRSFILQRSMSLLVESPITGHGYRGFEREYMLRQAAFFKEHPESEHALLADEMRHPLNEFVYIGINHGIGAPLALLALLLLPLWRYWRCQDEKMKPFVLPMLSVFVFSWFSYPFSQPLSWLVVGLSMLVAVEPLLGRWKEGLLLPSILLVAGLSLATVTAIDAVCEHRWYQAYRRSFHHDDALEDYESLHRYFRHNASFLYNYAMASFKRGDLDRAEKLLEECTPYWNGYNRELLLGDICLYQEKYDEAVIHFQKAGWMCPVRFAPLEGMYKAYDALNEVTSRDDVARMIESKHVKIHSADVMRIRMKCQ